MEKIKRFFECLVPTSVCNLKCEYCYIIEQKARKNELANFKYTAEEIGYALRKERIGGTGYFSICGAGETLMQKETLEIVKVLLKNGHFVNVTTNGTLTNRFEELLEMLTNEEVSRLQVAFSLHYLELKQKKLLDVFFGNVQRIRNTGASFLVQLNLYDGYIPYLEEIKECCMKEVGALPHIALTRTLQSKKSTGTFDIHTELSEKEYFDIGKTFDSKLFDFTCKNFNVKRKEFCYAGDWSACLNLATGELASCYFARKRHDIIKEPNRKIKWKAVGANCKMDYCVNSSHFLSLGVIPALDTPTYVELRNREEAGWYNKRMKDFLNGKLIEENSEYPWYKIVKIRVENIFSKMLSCGKRIVLKITKRV